MRRTYILIILCLIFHTGCQATASHRSRSSSAEEIEESLGTVAGALSNKTLNKEDLEQLEKQIRSDKQARQAVGAIKDALTGQVIVKYCPVDGERYSHKFLKCPTHDVHLEVVED